ncbi:UTP--glucose-1-phosphate uridylyltransferase GalU [Dissulfurirhabdus thermomarina]|uniref:UTP--glucose-1-phosphate uridylyltransferase n=1 Tax=Dissulfurirhabdus thermomarina TaxID=1765737 RepID=A0A6N9TKH5_DISTH|nr:UTP--glucose-1-phosphate uridylyltransferase GalU [Dissulfurirhabdus thermomarina]NDY41771.1 UTP--glucose-1-phosphate uridylyltransferase GalU [Dissulfurirhabdus thermomarina]NMX24018.1 UTP--glucose-1-phosphate uridylyltransferase GalU [Dissulfurirhabdus thermomarina]
MTDEIRKAVVPVAGLGTRFLPATKAIPKEMLTIVDRPTIQYIVEEVVASGLKEVILVTASGKSAIEDHFDYSFELETFLAQKGKEDLLREVQHISRLIDVVSVRQKEPLGLGHAVRATETVVGDEPFAVVLGDDLVDADIPCVFQMRGVFQEVGEAVVAVQRVPPEETYRYGIVEGEPVAEGVYKVTRLIEKPRPGTTDSNLAIIGRYILRPEIFDCLRRTTPGVGGEIQLTDALDLLRAERGLYAYEFHGQRFDAGDKFGYLQATVRFALDHPELGRRFRAYLRQVLEAEKV